MYYVSISNNYEYTMKYFFLINEGDPISDHLVFAVVFIQCEFVNRNLLTIYYLSHNNLHAKLNMKHWYCRSSCIKCFSQYCTRYPQQERIASNCNSNNFLSKTCKRRYPRWIFASVYRRGKLIMYTLNCYFVGDLQNIDMNMVCILPHRYQMRRQDDR